LLGFTHSLPSPNNGWAESHFKRRQAWDETLIEFIRWHKSSSRKNIIWAGDLNVAPLDADLSHPSHYKRQVVKTAGQPPVAPENVGQPGCTSAERSRCESILAAGGLVDLYRHVHPATPASGSSNSKEKIDLFQPIFSWRGYRAGKHSGRGMRIDHFIGSEALAEHTEDVKIMGHGGDRIGFIGSDHCPMILYLKQIDASD
jgi:AP endonuclease 1